MNSPSKKLVTAALPYANGPIHIGHLAGAYLPADIYARYLRLKGEDTLFVCGSDEHGAAITLRAKKEGKKPQEIVNQYHELNKKAFEDFGISFDIFHRTSDPLHHETAQDFFLALNEKGVFEKEEKEQFYDEEFQQFLADRYITGTCPKCHNPGAYGDQCEKCGSSLNPQELIDPVSTLSGNKPILKKTTHWFLPMQEHETWLKEWIEEGVVDSKKQHDPKSWRKHVIGQCKSWIDGGLQARAMTRDLDWGVKVPLKDASNKVLYVWLDAPIGYISATKAWAKKENKDWKAYWQSSETDMVHFIGKDNIVFHCIIFPIILKAHGNYNLPVNVPANEFLNLEGQKLSTSRNWAVWLHEYLADFPEKQDVLRYVLCSIAPETKDSEFTWEDFQTRNNSELVGIYGNFVNRALVLTHKYFDGEIPQAKADLSEYQSIVDSLKQYAQNCNQYLQAYRFRDALVEAMAIARLGNKFLADTEPWKLIKTDEAKVKDILFISLQIAANCAVAFEPFLPDSSKKLKNLLNLKSANWESLGSLEILQSGNIINKAEHLFQKIEDEQISLQVQKLKATEKQTRMEEKKYLPLKEMIQFDDFSKLDLRLGTVTTAEAVKKSNKLLQLDIDLGFEKRTILSGIAKHYTAEEMVGKQVVVVANLAPRKMMGVESQGMVLMAENSEGELNLINTEDSFEPGSNVS